MNNALFFQEGKLNDNYRTFACRFVNSQFPLETRVE